MNLLPYENKDLFTTDGEKFWRLPHIYSPDISLVEENNNFVLDQKSQETYKQLYEQLRSSPINKKGAAIVFGTFDNLHAGHKLMLDTAAAVCDELYVGVEDQKKALIRKNFKHPILPNEDRVKMVTDYNPEYKAFARINASGAIRSLLERGVPLRTVVIGNTQMDNLEMVSALEYCKKSGIQVLVTSRAKNLNRERGISSSELHRLKMAKVSVR